METLDIINPAEHAMRTKIIMLPTLVVLENGALVKMRRRMTTRLGEVTAEIVLCHIHNKVTPFVTWQRNMDQFIGCYWGHYFSDAVEAFNDFNDRGH